MNRAHELTTSQKTGALLGVCDPVVEPEETGLNYRCSLCGMAISSAEGNDNGGRCETCAANADCQHERMMNRRDVDQTNPCEYTEDYDWSEYNFDDDPDWR